MDHDQIEVSVHVITYLHERYIKQCLESLLNQKTNFKYQVIVGEDASPDGTRSILLEMKKEYGDKLVLVLHDENVGPSNNAKSLYAFDRGKYIASCEGDDYWCDEYKLQKQYDILEANPQFSAVCSDFKTINQDGSVVAEKTLGIKEDYTSTMEDWINNGYSLHTCTVFRRANIINTADKKYLELVGIAPTMGDNITFTLLYDYGDIYVIKDSMSAHRLAGKEDISSFTMRQKNDPLKYTRMYIDIFSALNKYFDQKYDFMPCICRRIAHMEFGKERHYWAYSDEEMKKIKSNYSLKWKLCILKYKLQYYVRGAIKKLKANS